MPLSPDQMHILQKALRQLVTQPSPVITRNKNLWFYLKQLKGTLYRKIKHRQTKAININGQSYFVKLHDQLNWKEALKPLFQARLPTIGAQYEWKAIAHCEQHHILTTPRVAYGVWGYWIWQRSFLITHALHNLCSLEELGQHWKTTPPNIQLKRQVIRILANTAHQFHQAGMNHCDFYACHFLVPNAVLTSTQAVPNLPLFILDLHRVRIRKHVLTRDLIKDLSALLFSILDYPINYRDCLYFLRYYYQNKPLNAILSNQLFWKPIIKRALALYQKENKQRATTALALKLQQFTVFS